MNAENTNDPNTIKESGKTRRSRLLQFAEPGSLPRPVCAAIFVLMGTAWLLMEGINDFGILCDADWKALIKSVLQGLLLPDPRITLMVFTVILTNRFSRYFAMGPVGIGLLFYLSYCLEAVFYHLGYLLPLLLYITFTAVFALELKTGKTVYRRLSAVSAVIIAAMDIIMSFRLFIQWCGGLQNVKENFGNIMRWDEDAQYFISTLVLIFLWSAAMLLLILGIRTKNVSGKEDPEDA